MTFGGEIKSKEITLYPTPMNKYLGKICPNLFTSLATIITSTPQQSPRCKHTAL
jgi:hypothetical protein